MFVCMYMSMCVSMSEAGNAHACMYVNMYAEHFCMCLCKYVYMDAGCGNTIHT